MSKKETKAKENKEQNTSAETEEKAVDTEVEETKEPTVEDQLADVKKQLAYTAAEYANFRARSAKEKEQTYSNAKGNVVAEILPVIDNLERALDQDGEDFEALKKGVEMTLEGLMSALSKIGVEAYGESGESFDPNFHNAVMHIEDDGLEENVITDVFQKGYKIGDRVIRPAMVKTAN
ncbi:MAG: nucleotide exchange factor GrpE [Eubacterium coprostanoligenes]|uniref:nucleotide exchange factor GrpE n=1 Tax=Eubacterium coprostanoligenes TaxID=290054 RepID=UPI0023574193|nr:nucleotide exchange factor GrpE [Eubacterium coprostanoligenes]MCI7265255.1 nucleotide exchange factor GrpE [Eubacterium coprostanoligenes]